MSGGPRRHPYLPFCDLNSLEVLEVGGGRARCATTVGSWLEGAGRYSLPAAVAALADMVLMYAASTRATPGMMPVTAGLRLDLWAAPPGVGTRLLGESRVEGAEGDLLLVTGRIASGERTLATATIRSMLVPTVGTASSERPAGQAPGEPPGGARPARRPGSGKGTALDAVLDLPAARLAGLDLVEAGEGALVLSAHAGVDLERTGGVLHGGAVPLLATLGSSALLAGTLPEGMDSRRLDVTCDYVRPTMIGTDVVVRSAVVQRSRRLVKTHTEILGPDGRPTARVYETAAIEPSGPPDQR